MAPLSRMPEANGENMTIDRVDRTVVTESATIPAGQTPLATDTAQATVRTDSRRITTTASPGGSEMTRRIVVLIFGLIQLLIGARIVLLILDAREANGLVSAILDSSQIFVAPFEGILRAGALHAAGSVLDTAAIVAFVGWTIIELIVIYVIGIFRREPA